MDLAGSSDKNTSSVDALVVVEVDDLENKSKARLSMKPILGGALVWQRWAAAANNGQLSNLSITIIVFAFDRLHVDVQQCSGAPTTVGGVMGNA